MKQVKLLAASIILTVLQTKAIAQEKVEVNGQDVGSWFSTHWMWVVGGIVLLLLLIIIGSGSGGTKTKKTTIVKDNVGNVKSVTTTETID
jgi:hypothetical protein